jgi:hypothetical protein
MVIALIAAGCMLIQDTLNSLKVQAQSRRHGWMAGCIDVVSWLCFLLSTKFSLDAINGHSTTQKVMVIGLVSCSNLFGQRLGESVGRKFVADTESSIDVKQNKRIETIEDHLGLGEQ